MRDGMAVSREILPEREKALKPGGRESSPAQ
jgi:hypothetical protein